MRYNGDDKIEIAIPIAKTEYSSEYGLVKKYSFSVKYAGFAELIANYQSDRVTN
jgi:hypothetical protein